MPGRTFDDFDPYAKDYRNIHTQNIRISGADSFYFAEMKVKLVAEHEDSSFQKVLDVGCGDGVTERFMNEYFPSWELFAIDVSSKSIEEARRMNISAAFSVYDGKHIPFGDDTFSIVFMAGVLHHVDKSFHKELISEIARVLAKGGRFYLFEHNPNNPVTKKLVRTCVFDKDATLLGNGYINNLLEQNFRILKKRFIIFFPRKGILSKLVFLEKYLQWLPLGGQYYFVAEKS